MVDYKTHCTVCELAAQVTLSDYGRWLHVRGCACGQYGIPRFCAESIDDPTWPWHGRKHVLAGVLRQAADAARPLDLRDLEVVKRLLDEAPVPKTTEEKKERVFKAIYDEVKTKSTGATLRWKCRKEYTRFFLVNGADLVGVIRLLEQDDHVGNVSVTTDDIVSFTATSAGYRLAERTTERPFGFTHP